MNPIVKMTLAAVITALVIGGGTYWYVNNKATTDKTALQTTIDKLNADIIALNKKVTDLTPATALTPGTTTPTTTSKTYIDSTYGYSFDYDNAYSTSTNKSIVDAWGGDGWWEKTFSGYLGKTVSRLASAVLSNTDNTKQIHTAVFNFGMKNGDYIPEGSDRSVAAKKTADNVTTGYFLGGIPSLGVESTCAGRNLFIPKGNNTIMITVYGCGVSETALEQTRSSILSSFKFTK